jgi:hypothetical protein
MTALLVQRRHVDEYTTDGGTDVVISDVLDDDEELKRTSVP